MYGHARASETCHCCWCCLGTAYMLEKSAWLLISGKHHGRYLTSLAMALIAHYEQLCTANWIFPWKGHYIIMPT